MPASCVPRGESEASHQALSCGGRGAGRGAGATEGGRAESPGPHSRGAPSPSPRETLAPSVVWAPPLGRQQGFSCVSLVTSVNWRCFQGRRGGGERRPQARGASAGSHDAPPTRPAPPPALSLCVLSGHASSTWHRASRRHKPGEVSLPVPSRFSPSPRRLQVLARPPHAAPPLPFWAAAPPPSAACRDEGTEQENRGVLFPLDHNQGGDFFSEPLSSCPLHARGHFPFLLQGPELVRWPSELQTVSGEVNVQLLQTPREEGIKNEEEGAGGGEAAEDAGHHPPAHGTQPCKCTAP